MRRDFGSISYNNKPTKGYSSAEQHQYYSERYVTPSYVDIDVVQNRRQRRLAAKSIHDVALNSEVRKELEWEKLGNEQLPIASHEDEIRRSVRDNQVTIIMGETGSGKSTQVPQMILKDGRSSKMMQPRRLAAEMIEERISDEVAGTYPEADPSVVGCITADKNTVTPDTRISIVTDGVMLKQLMRDFERDVQPVFIPDEVHEFKVETEVMLAMLKREIQRRPDLRTVLMSGSIDAGALRDYFADVTTTTPSIVEVPVRMFEVKDAPAPESTVVEESFKYGMQGMNVLCFVEGKREISDTINALRAKFLEAKVPMPMILPLHAKLPQSARQAAMAEYPNGKIIVSTEVAETSITISDISVVVDCGRKREPHLDGEYSQSLDIVLAARSNLIQRKGRSGRVKDGTYVLTRPSEDDEYVSFDDPQRLDYPIPEIQRTEVDRTVLYTAAIGIDITELDFRHPIETSIVERAQRSLRTLGALDENNEITSIGHRMETLPMSPSLTRMIVESERYSANTRAQITAIAAAVECGGMQFFAQGVGKKWSELVHQNESDMIAQLELFMAARNMSQSQQVEYNLDPQNIDRAKVLYRKTMKRLGIPVESLVEPNDIELDNIKRCILTGMIDYVYEYEGNGEYMRAGIEYVTPREISNRSVVKGNAPMIVGHPYRYEYYSDGEVVSKHIVEKVTKVNTPAVLGEIAASMCTWRPGEYQLRGGRLMQRQSQYFQAMELGVTRELEAPADEQSAEYLVRHMMNNPGKALRELFAIESHIKMLQRLSPDAPESIQQKIVGLVEWAVQESELNEDYADNLLRSRIEGDGIKIESIISHEEMAHIYESSPRSVETSIGDLFIGYEKGTPLVKRRDLDELTILDEQPTLEDGRPILFVGEHGRRYSLADLHAGRHKTD